MFTTDSLKKIANRGKILNQPEGVVFAITTASLYIILLIAWLPNKSII